jgi:hypothetical protein
MTHPHHVAAITGNTAQNATGYVASFRREGRAVAESALSQINQQGSH